ncbi:MULTISPECIES: magnesium transporter MgtE N-terminal domain-containing protein [unclassified Aeromicrobium]|uniref:magnesium transporter MgtE N-terminal domain-containing protein n=1 Tax=unclassified Aeromicrobium TaxID=2633570 RepID=UPI002889B12A|nr:MULTISPECIES: CBS domain-containing protein [unclassified Aeromicrobium]
MSSSPGRIFLSRIVGQEVFDPAGDQVGKLRDVVVAVRSARQRPRVVGLVVEVLGRRRVFLPIGRVTSLDSGQIITTGVLNVRRFEKRSSETLAIHELLDRTVSLPDQRGGTVYDLAMEQDTRRDWFIGTVAVQETGKRFGRRGATHVVDWDEVTGLVGEEASQGATHLLATMDEMRPADLANALLDLPAKRRTEIVGELVDERLADVLEELPDTVQVEILGVLDPERAADVLEEMDPDDAADLLGELPTATSEQLLALMEPEDAEDVRRLLVYEDRTAGGMMTTEPVILPPDATIAEALARVREPEIGPALASMVYVCRPPVETPTGRFLGIVHVQALLREPPSTLVGGLADNDIDWPRPDATLEQVASLLASYDMLALPVVDENNHLIGAVTIDDVLDHLLPEGWRERDPSPRPAEVTTRG